MGSNGKMMKKLPLGLQSFRKIMEDGYVYADKTQYIYDLINDESYYFLSRPRRFGKSLLLDTIAEAFSGDKELLRDYSFTTQITASKSTLCCDWI